MSEEIDTTTAVVAETKPEAEIEVSNTPVVLRRSTRPRAAKEAGDSVTSSAKRSSRKRSQEPGHSSVATDSEADLDGLEADESDAAATNSAAEGNTEVAAQAEATDANTSALDSTLEGSEPAEFDDGGFLLAVNRLVQTWVGLGIYAYALWVALMTAVWLGSLHTFKGVSVSFGGASLDTAVPLYEGVTEVASKNVKGHIVFPSFSFTLFPSTITDSTAATFEEAIQVNLVLLALFAIQHTIGASVAARHILSKYFGLPSGLDHSVYVLTSAALAHATVLNWVPINTTVWKLACGCPHSANIYVTLFTFTFAIAVFLAFAVTFLVGHFDFFGVSAAAGKAAAATPFVKDSLFSHVRHPLHAALIVALFSSPIMTVGRLLFAVGVSLFLIIHSILKDQEMISVYGEDYLEYKQSVPALVSCTLCSGSCWLSQLLSGAYCKKLFGSSKAKAAAPIASSPAKTDGSALFSDGEE